MECFTAMQAKIRKGVMLLLLPMMALVSAQGQRVIWVDHPHQSDLKVWLSEHAHQADLLVYWVGHPHQVRGEEGWWHLVRHPYQADWKLFRIAHPHQADIRVHVVDHPHQAGWRKGRKTLDARRL